MTHESCSVTYTKKSTEICYIPGRAPGALFASLSRSNSDRRCSPYASRTNLNVLEEQWTYPIHSFVQSYYMATATVRNTYA